MRNPSQKWRIDKLNSYWYLHPQIWVVKTLGGQNERYRGWPSIMSLHQMDILGLHYFCPVLEVAMDNMYENHQLMFYVKHLCPANRCNKLTMCFLTNSWPSKINQLPNFCEKSPQGVASLTAAGFGPELPQDLKRRSGGCPAELEHRGAKDFGHRLRSIDGKTKHCLMENGGTWRNTVWNVGLFG